MSVVNAHVMPVLAMNTDGNACKYRCEECGIGYPTVKDLMSHQGVHSGECPYVCEYCQKGYKTKPNLVNHINMHLGEGYPCDKCKKVYPSAFLLKQHSRFHVNGKLFDCKICGKAFKVVEMLRNHTKQAHGDAGYSCTFCKIKLLSEKALEAHVKKHVLKKTMVQKKVCPHCNRTYNSMKSLKKHLLVHEATSDNLLKCPDCEDKFVHEARLKYHQERYHSRVSELECIYCGLNMESQEALQLHIMDHRKVEPARCQFCGGALLRRHLHTDWDRRDPFPCSRCAAIFPCPARLLDHVRIHGDDPDKFSWSCNTCGARFLCKSQHARHLAKPHPLTPGTVNVGFRCGTCNKEFKSQELLKDHVQIYVASRKGTDPVDLLCHDCGKVCNSLSGLNKHRRSHRETNFYPCLYCSDVFKTIAPLRIHMKSHLERTDWYQCYLCNLQILKKSTFILHFNSHLKDSDRVCVKCSLAFPTVELSASHKQMHDTLLKCSMCDKEFESVDLMREHLWMEHDRAKLTLCPRCNLALRSKLELKEHEKNHVQEDMANAERAHKTQELIRSKAFASSSKNNAVELETFCTCFSCKRSKSEPTTPIPFKIMTLAALYKTKKTSKPDLPVSDLSQPCALPNLSHVQTTPESSQHATRLTPSNPTVTDHSDQNVMQEANGRTAPVSARTFMASFLKSDTIGRVKAALKSSKYEYDNARLANCTAKKLLLPLPVSSTMRIAPGTSTNSQSCHVSAVLPRQEGVSKELGVACQQNANSPASQRIPSCDAQPALVSVGTNSHSAATLQPLSQPCNSLLTTFLELLVRILGSVTVQNLSVAISSDLGGFVKKFLPNVEVNATAMTTEDTIWLFIQSMVYLFGGETEDAYCELNDLDSRSLMEAMLGCINAGLLDLTKVVATSCN